MFLNLTRHVRHRIHRVVYDWSLMRSNHVRDDDAGDYSDEDDASWKVRRASSKLLASVIATRPELLSEMYNTVAPALIRRFSEREESVRVDILNTFIELVKQTGKTGGGGEASSVVAATAAADGSRDSKRRKGDVE